MLVREGLERNHAVDLRLASLLAAVAGALNAAAFYAVGFFSANMTGNVSTVSDDLALGRWATALFYLAILLTFIIGATASALMIGAGQRRGVPGIYAYSVLMEAALLAGLGAADLWLLESWRVPVMVLGLAFLMGLQNAVVTRISGARVRTTHVSGMATDIGIELATAFDLMRGRQTVDDTVQNRAKLRLHLCTILSFLIGGIVGVIVYRAIDGWLLIVTAAVLLAPAVTGIRRSQSMRTNRVSGDIG